MSLIIPFSEACERNKDPILEVLLPYMEKASKALEIGSGTGQHLAHFAAACPQLKWQPTDQRQYLEGLEAQFRTNGSHNIATVRELDVTQQPWLDDAPNYDLIYSANTLHIMPWETVECLFNGLPNLAKPNAKLFIYGPFKFYSEHTSASNQSFDLNLKARGVGSGIRDFEAVNELAGENGFKLIQKQAMPANNFSLVWEFARGLLRS